MAKTSKSKAKKVTVKKTAGNGKGATIVGLLRRKEGATLADLTKATGWQPHSVRGFLSASLGSGPVRSPPIASAGTLHCGQSTPDSWTTSLPESSLPVS